MNKVNENGVEGTIQLKETNYLNRSSLSILYYSDVGSLQREILSIMPLAITNKATQTTKQRQP